MSDRDKELLDFIDVQSANNAPYRDILEIAPELSIGEAYRLQFASIKRRVAAGDRIVGYKVAQTRLPRKGATLPVPVVGSLIASRCFDDGHLATLRDDTKTQLEAEVAILIQRDLKGPGITTIDAIAAVAGYFPALEFGERRFIAEKQSAQMGIVLQKTSGGIVVGRPLSAPHGLDLRLEGVVLSVNGEARLSATAVQVLGDPINSVVLVANKLAEYGEYLKAGMIVMTGSIMALETIVMEDTDARAEFTRIGNVNIRFGK